MDEAKPDPQDVKGATGRSDRESTQTRLQRIEILATVGVTVATILGLILAVQANIILRASNKLLDASNELLKTQNELIDAERRATLAADMPGILDRLSVELQDTAREAERLPALSKVLEARIVAMSQTLRPYRILDDSNRMVGPASPERAQLLRSLVATGVANATLNKADFSAAHLDRWSVGNRDLRRLDLRGSLLPWATFAFVDLGLAKLDKSDLRAAQFTCTNLRRTNLDSAILKGTGFDRSFLPEPEFFDGAIADSSATGFRDSYVSSDDWIAGFNKAVGEGGIEERMFTVVPYTGGAPCSSADDDYRFLAELIPKYVIRQRRDTLPDDSDIAEEWDQ